MFEKRRAVLAAAGVGYLLSGFLVAATAAGVFFVSRQDPHRMARQWEQLLEQRAVNAAILALGGVVLFAVALAAGFFFLAVAARAARVHPTSARMAGLLLAAGTLALVAVATWTGVVAPYAAMQYHAASDQMRRHALLIEAHLNEHVVLLGFWCFLGFTAAGLYFLGRALRGERGWTADALKIAAALLALHLPTWLYVAQESLLNDNYVRWLAVVDQLLLCGSLAAAFYFGARWLRHVGRTLPR